VLCAPCKSSGSASKYGTKLALDQVSFGIEVPAGLKRAAGAPNGGWSQSTLMALFSRYTGCKHGRHPVGGVSLRRQPEQALRAARVVFQQSKALDLGPEAYIKTSPTMPALQWFWPPCSAPSNRNKELARQSLLERPAPSACAS